MKIFRFVGIAAAIMLLSSARADDFDYNGGVNATGHHLWHHGFYNALKRPIGGGSCCNDQDCRPTKSRWAGDHHEVLVNDVWMEVPSDAVLDVIAPDAGAHVCFETMTEVGSYVRDLSTRAGHKSKQGVFTRIYCVILPPDS